MEIQYIQKIINQTISRLKLNLKNSVVYTEAPSGNYIFTPIIAALAGSNVIAFSKDSTYGKSKDIRYKLINIAKKFKVSRKIKIVSKKEKQDIAMADIVTNSGLIRPLDKYFIKQMKPTAVIALMFEDWELRDIDIDVHTCKKMKIKIAGLNEEHPLVDVFSYVGILAIKMLIEAKIEIYKCKIAILSNDKFGITIKRFLTGCGAQAELIHLNAANSRLGKSVFDVIIYADYRKKLSISSTNLKNLKKNDTKIIQFLGGINFKQIKNAGIPIYPDNPIPSTKMAQTFANLGPKPIIELQTAGLKAAEIVLSNKSLDKKNPFFGLAQFIR